MGELPKGDLSAESLHNVILEQVLGSRASDSLVYSYKRSLNGFAAKLSEEEAKKISEMEGVVSVIPSKMHQLHTTRSWDFMGFTKTVKRSVTESDLIVGMLDTGIWPESKSFSDKRYGSPPSKWKGICQSPANLTCNNKIVGARYYHSGEFEPGEFNSPRDSEGHGSHTSSTVAGIQSDSVSLEGLGAGTARGGVPSARIAVYKVCWSFGCTSEDILAAFDDAIADGVDIISISLGGGPTEYFEDIIAIGAFHAMKNGILTSMSAGNSGPDPESVSNAAPWALTVAASTIDRHFVTNVVLGNGQTYQGVSINTFSLKTSQYSLIYGGSAPNKSAGYDGSESRYCDLGTLDERRVKGKIVFCDQLTTGEGQLAADALGTIMQESLDTDYAFSYPLPAAFFSEDVGIKIYEYLNSTRYPTAYIPKTSQVIDSTAPVVVSFSSRGPNPITRDILKPDLSAPGVNILAAWSPVASISLYEGDTRSELYNIISGTSMSCPHATGAAAYIKSFYPKWSPAAIKSALMTTAYPMKQTTNTDHEFAYGAGHINPVQAVNPGLVYDAGELDYVAMLCSEGYDTKKLRLITGDKSVCPNSNGSVWDLNYPSFAVSVAGDKPFSATFKRTVTNVGSPNSTYEATVSAPSGIVVTVEPDILSFQSLGEKQSFVLKVTGKTLQYVLSASLVWRDGVHQVRSPIVVHATTS
ncbi:cucumisin-like [Aristolochia californica]|uniref:cucumisin-like n=1 Tax=Aristolochia californica TaxID=171875 RepID=UPI0035DE47FB